MRSVGCKFFVRPIDYNLLIILAWPLLILSVDDTWLFSYVLRKFIDPWVYFGYFLDLPQHLRIFAGTYYGSRLSWILPGFLVYRLFSPLVAAYVLHLALYYSAVISLYLILKQTLNDRVALLAGILMGSYTFFLWEIGWDYVFGAGITYFLLTMCMLTGILRSPGSWLWLSFGGIFYGAMVYSQLFFASLTPVIIGYYFFVSRDRRLRDLLFFAIGILILTLLFCVVNYSLDGDFLFFLPSISFASGLLRTGNPWRASTYAWLPHAVWLLLPAFTLLCSGVFLLVRGNIPTTPGSRFVFFFPMYFLCNVLTMIAWQLSGQPVLQYAYYTSLLMPSMFLAIGSQLDPIVRLLNSRQYCLLVCGVVLFLLLSFSLPLDSRLISKLNGHASLLTAVLALLSSFVFFHRQIYTRVLLVFLVCAMVFVINMAGGTRVGLPGGARALEKDAFLAVVKGVRAIESMDPKGSLLFWYNIDSSFGGVMRSISSAYLWGYRLFSERFPAVDSRYQVPAPHTKMVILSSSDVGVFSQAKEAMAQMGFQVRLLTERIIEQGSITLRMTFIEVDKSSR